MKKQIFATLLLVIVALTARSQQVIRNLGFEQVGPRGQILSWDTGDTKKQYIIKLDTAVFHKGRTSISIESLPNWISENGVAGAESIIFTTAFRLKRTVKISAFIKTETMTDGVAGIAMRISGKEKVLAFTDSGKDSKTGTNDWSLCEIELPLTSDVLSVGFALQVTGKGKAWFDDVKITIDGKVIASSSYEEKSNLIHINDHTD